MTCICGIVANNHIWMGGDSASSTIYVVSISLLPKVFRKGEFLIGMAGSWRQMQLIHYSLTIPKRETNQDIETYMVTTVVDSIRNCLTAGGSGLKQNDQEKTESEILIGYSGKLFRLNSDYGISEHKEFESIGSGHEVAKGALYATKGKLPKNRIIAALSAAEEHTPYVRSPFIVLDLPYKIENQAECSTQKTVMEDESSILSMQPILKFTKKSQRIEQGA